MSAPSADADKKPEISTRDLILRMLALGWEYRYGCLKLILLQGILLITALTTLRLVGLGIDITHHFADPQHIPLPPFPLGLTPPPTWSPMQVIGAVAATILALEVTRGLLNYTYALSAGYLIHTKIVVDLRAKVYDKLQRLHFGFFDTNATGSIINRVTGDVQSLRSFIDGVVIQLVILLLSFLFYFSYMSSLHLGLTLATLGSTPILALSAVLFSKMVRPEYDRNRELSDRVVLRLAESIQGVQVIKGFGREQLEIDQFAKDNLEVQEQQQSIFWKVSLFVPFIGYLTQINLVILLAYGGYLVSQKELAFGSGLVVFAGLLQQFSSQIANLTNIANSVQQSLSASRRVFEILDTPISIQSPADPVHLPTAKGALQLEQVSFGYTPSALALQNVSIAIEAGQRIGIMGPTGSGKTTLLSLVCRFYDPSSGHLTLDGHNLKALAVDDLRRNIGIVFQETFLFSNTIAANIAFGHPNATPQQIEAAAKVAACHDFISALPQGYETILGEGGLDLSGGQRQRLAIARAVLLDPAILLLDDPAAAIDPHTEHEILESLQSATQQRTTLIVAHRLSTLRSCDKIVVLEQGRVTQFGTPQELLKQPGYYREAALTQMGEAAAC